MHSAPSVNYPVGRSAYAAVLLLLAWMMGTGVCALWWAHGRVSSWRLGAALLVIVVTGSFAAWSWWRSPSGVLAWDGETWSWLADGQAHGGMPEVGLDLQHRLLIYWTGPIVSRWILLERAAQIERWDDLRRALYSRARLRTPPPVAQPFVAKP